MLGDVRLRELEHGLIQGITLPKILGATEYSAGHIRWCQAEPGWSYPAADSEAPGSSCTVQDPSEQQNIQTWKKTPVPTLGPKLVGSAST